MSMAVLSGVVPMMTVAVHVEEVYVEILTILLIQYPHTHTTRDSTRIYLLPQSHRHEPLFLSTYTSYQFRSFTIAVLHITRSG